MSDVLNLALLTKTQRYKLDYTILHQKLIELVTDSRKSTYSTQIDSHLNVIQG